MKIDLPLRELGIIKSDALIAAIVKTKAEDWEVNKYRQQTYDAHHSTRSLVMLFSETINWPHITVSREAGWDILAETAQPLIDQIIATHYPPGGLAYEVNNQLMHSVLNKGKEDRINFIFDYAPPSHMNNFTFSFS